MTGSAGLDGREVMLAALAEIRTDLASNADHWENDTLDRYLEALEAVLDSVENHYLNTSQPLPTNAWELMARAVKWARYYE